MMSGSASYVPAWQTEVIEKLTALVEHRQGSLVSIVTVGGVDIILVDRRLPAGRVTRT